MPTYKDKERGTWYASFYYEDWTGQKKRKVKRGFKTQREAKQFETEFKAQNAADPTMTFESLYALYVKDSANRKRETTQIQNESVYRVHILPYFKDKPINEITPGDVRVWQNTLMSAINPRSGKPYSPTYLRTLNSGLSKILNYAVKYQNLSRNPCLLNEPMGEKKRAKFDFWTLDEFNNFIKEETLPAYHLCYNILFWTGMREGEMLALTPAKILHEKKALKIDQTFHIIKGKQCVGPPKSKNGIREVPIPDFLYAEIVEYLESIYGIQEDERIFYFGKSAVNREFHHITEVCGNRRIRVHDLRHSHVSMLIKLGYRTHAIADRIGDTPEEVDKTYAHLYPDTADEIANELSKHQNGFTQ